MRIRNALMAGAAITAMITAPAFAATLRGKIVAIDDDTITVMSDGRSVVYILPPNVEIAAPQNQEVTLSQLRGQTVTLTVDEGSQAASGQPEKPQVTNITIEGDLEIDSESEVDD